MFSNIVKLAAESSLLNELMVDYLKGLINQLNDVGWQIDDKTLLVEDFAIEQRVITKIERKWDEKDEQRFSTGLEPTSKFYEIESDSERYETITWSNAVNEKNLRLGIKGSPGSGKTFSSRYTVIKIADESLYKLQSHSAKLEDIEIPIWITAKELSNCSETKIADALIGILKQKLENLNLTDYFYDWLKRQMQAVFNPQESTSTNKNPFFVVVDALDELSGKDEFNNFERLVKKLDKPLVKLLATCRTLQWDGRRGLLGWKGLKSLELAPLKKYQKVEFLERFFSQNEKAKESAKTIFDNNYAVDYATDNSLILTFVCFLHLKGKIDENTTYIKIYANMQHELFIGSWKKEKAFWFEEGKTSRYSKRLDKIAFSIFSKKPDSNHFTLDAWDEAVEEIGLTEEESDKFREELVRIGFLVKAGVDELGDECWSFLHRTILEFTVGKAIFKRDDWFEIAKKHYCDFAWLETLTFVAGLGDGKTKAKLMIDDLENEMQDGYLKNEIFGVGILLQAKFTGVSKLGGKDIELICDRVIYGLSDDDFLIYNFDSGAFVFKKVFDFKPNKRKLILKNQCIYKPFIIPACSQLEMNKSCNSYIFENLVKPISESIKKQYNDKLLRMDEINAISKLGKISDDGIEFLFKILADKNTSVPYKEAIIEVISKIAKISNTQIDFLINFAIDLNNHGFLRLQFTEVLSKLRKLPTKLIDFHIKFVADERNEDVLRVYTIKTLGEIGKISDEQIITLIKFVDDKNIGFKLRHEVIELLFKFAKVSQKGIDFLIGVASDENSEDYLRISAIVVLGDINQISNREIHFLTKIAVNERKWFAVRHKGIQVLDKLDKISDEMIEVLNKFITENHPDLSNYSLEVLTKLGKISYDTLFKFATDKDVKDRPMTAIMLLDNFNKITDEIINLLIEFSDSDTNPWSLKSAGLLGKFATKYKTRINPESVLAIIKICLRKLKNKEFLLDRYGYYSQPLFQIWQTYRTPENKLLFTWDMLEMSDEELAKRFFPTA